MTAEKDDERAVEATSTDLVPAPERIPEIGEARRWYDLAYRAVRASQRSRAWAALPLRSQVWLSGPFMQRLMAFHQLDDYRARRADDDRHSLLVGSDEHVSLSTIWVVELFPPGEAPQLQTALARNRWQRSPHLVPFTLASETLDKSRSGSGPAWWEVADLVDVKAPRWNAGARRDRLPESFHAVKIFAVQLGPALTGVVARFELSDIAARAVDQTWHIPAEPAIHPQPNGVFLAEDRRWATMRATQEAQLALHDQAREWMRRRCPGAFANSATPATTLGLLLFDGLDPLDDEPGDRASALDRLRALGITDPPVHPCTADDLPGLAVEPVDGELCAALGGSDIHLLAGRRDRVGASLGPPHGHHGDLDATMIGRLVDSVGLRNYLIMQAVDSLLRMLEERHARLRDRARDQHRALSARAVRDLRSRVLAQNIDLDSLATTLADFAARKDYDAQVIHFQFDISAKLRRLDAEHGRPPFEPVDVVEVQMERQVSACARLREREDRLRDVLATATTLGSSADTFVISRITLIVALTSLTVALVGLLIAQPGSDSLLSTVVDLLRGLFAAPEGGPLPS